MNEKILVTGGAGFIGSNFVLNRMRRREGLVLNVDKLTYAGNLQNLESIDRDERHRFFREDVCDREFIKEVLAKYRPQAVIHFAAESHVDRSIHSPDDFIRTNVTGTFHLLEEAKRFWEGLGPEERKSFRFLHVSTDEVYGSLADSEPPFTEANPYRPNSPYSASKAASDHLVRAYFHTFGLPAIITNCSNNYGPFQFPEKLIPLMIHNALKGKELPVYGDGRNVRDWLYVQDHCEALERVLKAGRVGETYNIGGCNERKNIDVVQTICAMLDELRPAARPYAQQVAFVRDRLGHDRRYAIDSRKISEELGWKPKETFESGIRKTVQWYLTNVSWVEAVTSGEYLHWIEKHYEQKA